MTIQTMDWKHLMALFVVTTTYVALGGIVFSHIELENENRIKQSLREGLRTFLANHTCVSLQDINHLFLLVGDDVKLARISVYNATSISMWDVPGAAVFAITVLTTIGYGNLAPRTFVGQVVCVVYALFGIPIMMFLLKDIGEKLYTIAYRLYEFRFFKGKETHQKVFNGVLLVVLSFLTVIGLPGLLFSYLENWTVGQSFYYCFITLTTIGFGDFIAAESYNPKAPSGTAGQMYRWFVFVWIILGLSFLSLVISLLSKLMVSKVRFVEQYTSDKLETEVQKIQEEFRNVRNKYVVEGSRDSCKETETEESCDETQTRGITLIGISVHKHQSAVGAIPVTVNNGLELKSTSTNPHTCVAKTDSECTITTIIDSYLEVEKASIKTDSVTNSHYRTKKNDPLCVASMDLKTVVGNTNIESVSCVDSRDKVTKANSESASDFESIFNSGSVSDTGNGSLVHSNDVVVMGHSGSVFRPESHSEMTKTHFKSDPLLKSHSCTDEYSIICHCDTREMDSESADISRQHSSVQDVTDVNILVTCEKPSLDDSQYDKDNLNSTNL